MTEYEVVYYRQDRKYIAWVRAYSEKQAAFLIRKSKNFKIRIVSLRENLKKDPAQLTLF